MDKKWTNERGRKEPYTMEEINRGRENAKRVARRLVADSPILQEVVAARANGSQTTQNVKHKKGNNAPRGISLQNDLRIIDF